MTCIYHIIHHLPHLFQSLLFFSLAINKDLKDRCPAPTFSTSHFSSFCLYWFSFFSILQLVQMPFLDRQRCLPHFAHTVLDSFHCFLLLSLFLSISFPFSSLCFPFHCLISLIVDLYLCSVLILPYCYCFAFSFLIFPSSSRALIIWIPVPQSSKSFPHLLIPLLFDCPMLRLLYLVHSSHSWFSLDLGRFVSIYPSLRLAFSHAGLLQLYI